MAAIAHQEELWQQCRYEFTGVDVRIDGWDIRPAGSLQPQLATATGSAASPSVTRTSGNSQDNSSIDDTNPGLYTSTLWYGITWPDGRFGYISEVWIDPADRGGLGLPTC